jgi:hypothetical protein
MKFPNLREWAQPEEDTLPDNRDIRLQFKDGQLYVTGKRPGFSTWWFSYHTLSDAFIEMTFNTEDCSDEDAYGIIFRGPPHRAGQSYGYVVSFTCDEKLWVYRLDGVDPWDAETLIDEEEQDAMCSECAPRAASSSSTPTAVRLLRWKTITLKRAASASSSGQRISAVTPTGSRISPTGSWGKKSNSVR